jgi:DNA-binding HxlR family transcriptional regulator
MGSRARIVRRFEAVHSPRFQRGAELVGRRWTAVILVLMLNGATRFSEIKEAIPGLSDRLLSDRLRELEAERLVERTVHPAIPVRIRYALTEKGRQLAPVFDSIAVWAGSWL